ncbi:MAG: RDD family protein [Bdellovibrionota bacterium]
MGAQDMQNQDNGEITGLHRSQEVVEGIRIRLEPAPILKRTIAAAIDMGILGAASYGALIPLIFLGGMSAALDFGMGGKGIATIIVIGLYVIALMVAFHYYYIYFEYNKGATPGKKLMGLKVISVDGKRLTKGQAIYREIVRWYLDAIFLIPAAISIMVTQRRQRVGDVLAGTMVVYSKSREESQQFIYVKQEDYRAILAHLQMPTIPGDVRRSYLIAANRAFLMNEQMQLQSELSQWSAYFRGLLTGQAERLELNDTTVLRFMAEHCFQLDRKETEQKGWRNG